MGRDSQNLLPALLGDARRGPARTTMLHYARQGDLAIREGRWKLIPGKDGGELYDLQDDVAETRHLYKERPQVVRRLRAPLESQRSPSPELSAAPR